MSFWVAGGMAVVGAYSASESAKANNRAAGRAQANAARRYELQADQAEAMMDEQQIIARDKMTDVTRAFLVAKGKSKAIQAETMVTGASSQRVEAVQRSKFSEAKGKIAQEVDTNVINIAQDMITKKIDTEATIAEAESKKKNVFTETAMGAIQGGMQGYSLGSSMGGSTKPDTGKVGVKKDTPTSFAGAQDAFVTGDVGGVGWGF